LMTAITIVIALIVDFTFLPAFLMWIDKDKTEEEFSPDDEPMSAAARQVA